MNLRANRFLNNPKILRQRKHLGTQDGNHFCLSAHRANTGRDRNRDHHGSKAGQVLFCTSSDGGEVPQKIAQDIGNRNAWIPQTLT
jgi:hypothetical protein